MQFLAARSLCTTFLLLRYSIPLAIWWQKLVSLVEALIWNREESVIL